MSELIRSTRDVIIRTPDARAATNFYQQVLGLAVTQRVGDIVGFETGSLQLFVEQGDALPAVLDFLVQDVQARAGRPRSSAENLGFDLELAQFPPQRRAADPQAGSRPTVIPLTPIERGQELHPTHIAGSSGQASSQEIV
jgi:catechol 2,3-dioxygenase-like lactoylglutathione lyase family enzyme